MDDERKAMAILTFSELIECIKLHPRYHEFEKGTPPEHALVITFGEVSGPIETDMINMSDGNELYIDMKPDGTACSIEIA